MASLLEPPILPIKTGCSQGLTVWLCFFPLFLFCIGPYLLDHFPTPALYKPDLTEGHTLPEDWLLITDFEVFSLFLPCWYNVLPLPVLGAELHLELQPLGFCSRNFHLFHPQLCTTHPGRQFGFSFLCSAQSAFTSWALHLAKFACYLSPGGFCVYTVLRPSCHFMKSFGRKQRKVHLFSWLCFTRS